MKTGCTIKPPLGILRGVKDSEYHQWQGASHTRLNALIDRSPAHAYQEMHEGGKSTAAMLFGSAAHTLILQPKEFDSALFKPTDQQTLSAIGEAVKAHPAAQKLLTSASDLELSFAWEDTKTGVLCKGRADIVCESLSLAVDLKTTTNASKAAFARAVSEYGYHRQAAHYLAGMRACGLNIRHFLIIAVEKGAPNAVAVYRLGDPSILAGEVEIDRALKKWKECESSGHWPGYSDAIEDIEITSWKLNQINEATLEAM